MFVLFFRTHDYIHGSLTKKQERVQVNVYKDKNISSMVGNCLLQLEDDNSAILYSLFVKKNQRKQGIGSFVLKECEKYLKKRKINALYLLSNNNRPKLISWYEKNGFKYHSEEDIYVFLKKDLT